MRILVAPDSFKGSLSSHTFCHVIQEVVESLSPQTECFLCPMSDGGEGFVSCFLASSPLSEVSPQKKHFHAQRTEFPALDPLGRPVIAEVGWIIKGWEKWGVLEMASASGLPRLKPEEYNPLRASSYGTGQLVSSLIRQIGCRTVVMGFGGTATNDGGVGILEALGFSFLNRDKKPIPRGANGIKDIAQICPPPPDSPVVGSQFILATDVKNPLLGPRGASFVFAPQKGASAQDIILLEENMTHLAEVVRQTTGKNLASEPGSGAAGGAVFLLRSFLNSRVVSGFDLLAEKNHLPTHIKNKLFDLVITGEGCLDHQSFQGKVVGQLANLCQKYQVPLIALVGKTFLNQENLAEKGISQVHTLADARVCEKTAMTNAPQLLREKAREILAKLL